MVDLATAGCKAGSGQRVWSFSESVREIWVLIYWGSCLAQQFIFVPDESG